jgi:hypothetical protein
MARAQSDLDHVVIDTGSVVARQREAVESLDEEREERGVGDELGMGPDEEVPETVAQIGR